MNDKPDRMPNVPPFVKFVASAVPMVFDNSLSYYEALCALWKYIQGMTDVINNNATLEEEYIEKFNELKTFVDEYFDNLDVQEEINNKLDDMVEAGTLQEIITTYIQANTAWCFDSVADMKLAENFIAGSYAQTYGFFAKNDKGGAKYLIRNITNDDVIDESTLIEITGDPSNNLVAELVFEPSMNLTQFGVDHTSEDVTSSLNHVVNVCSAKNIELIIPEHTYSLKTPLTRTTGGYTYGYFIELLSDVNIKGQDKNKSILKVSDGSANYTGVLFNENDNIKNVKISNLTIEQYYLSGSTITPSNRSNNKNAIILYGYCENVTIDNVYFKNCCGVDVISFHDNSSTNIKVTSNIFDYHYVQGIAYYDRSIIYMECNNYIVKDNILHGNFETLGGIECHGYNGICTNNFIDKCAVAIHIAPKYDDTINAANIIVNGNIMNDNAQGIRIWYNTSSTATKGCKGISICNNEMKMAGYVYAQEFFTSSGKTQVKYVGGIMPAPTSEDKPLGDIKIDHNTIVINGYSSYTSYTSTLIHQFSGINLLGRNSLSNIQITNNIIEGMAGNAITFGDTRSSATTWTTTKNVIVEGNSILNCGYGLQSDNNAAKAYICIGRGDMTNVIVRNNTMTKTDDSYNTAYAVSNQGAAGMTKNNVYFTNNTISSVVNNVNETKVANSSGYYTLITDRGDTTNRPTTANAGDQYFDTTLSKMIVYNGSAWVNVNGTAL